MMQAQKMKKAIPSVRGSWVKVWGAFCYGGVTHVYRKVGRQSQKYRVRWDDGMVSQVLSEHLELVSVPEGSRDVGGGGRHQ